MIVVVCRWEILLRLVVDRVAVYGTASDLTFDLVKTRCYTFALEVLLVPVQIPPLLKTYLYSLSNEVFPIHAQLFHACSLSSLPFFLVLAFAKEWGENTESYKNGYYS